jgi:hypothetical protein
MQIFRQLRHAFQQRALRRLLRMQTGTYRQIQYDKTSEISILFNASDLKDREIVLQFADKLAQTGKKIHLLGFFDHPVLPTDFHFPVFTEKDFNINLKPLSPELTRFIQLPVPLLIHADTQPSLYPTAVAASVNNALRAGPYTEQADCYELMVDVTNNKNLSAFLSQIIILLEKTIPKH